MSTISVGYFSECVLTAIDLDPIRAHTQVYRTSKPVFYRWQFDQKKPTELPINKPADLSTQISQSLGKGTLLVRLEEPLKPEEIFDSSCVRQIKSGIKRKKAYEFKYQFFALSLQLLFHVVLPEYCYCDEKSLNQQNNVYVKSVDIEKRQSVTWVNIEGIAGRKYELRFVFYGPDEKEFKKRQNRIPQKIVIPQELKSIYREFKDLAPMALAVAGR